MYIGNRESFKAFIQRASESRFLAIDTEFLRERTYFARLCLLQIATESEVVIIDPFKVGDLKILAPLFEDESIVKVFHACDQDVEILYHEVGVTPKPLFDTQVAAALLGHPKQVGYGALVHSICGVSLRKADSFTDWSVRPLTESQLDYAADDVVYLAKMYDPMVEKLKSAGRLAWLERDFADLCDPSRFEVKPHERFRHLKRGNQLNRKQLSAARELAAWREERAINRNIPRKWVLTDEQIVEACKRESRTIDDLFMVRGMRDHLSTKDAREVVSRIVRGLDLPAEEWPEAFRCDRNERNVDIEVELMNALLKLRSFEAGVAPQAVASTNDLVQLARGHVEDLDLLRGWKYELIGKELERLLNGELSLRFENRSLVVSEC